MSLLSYLYAWGTTESSQSSMASRKRRTKYLTFVKTSFFQALLGFILILGFLNSESIRAYESINDFYVTIFSLPIFLTLRYFSSVTFFPIASQLIHNENWTHEEQENRRSRFGSCLFKLFYFLIISSIEFYLLKDTEWMPPSLGGSGDIHLSFYPSEASDTSVSPEIRVLYLIQLAYHLHSVIYQLFVSHRSDFFEMIVHHMSTVFLVFYSYIGGYQRIGTLVFFVHDFGDIVGYAVKSSVDTKFKRLTLSIYFCLLVSWGYLRLYVLPRYIVREIVLYVLDAQIFGGTMYVMLVCTLQALHVYWYVCFLIMGFRYSKSGETVDTVEDLSEEPKEKKAAFATVRPGVDKYLGMSCMCRCFNENKDEDEDEDEIQREEREEVGEEEGTQEVVETVETPPLNIPVVVERKVPVLQVVREETGKGQVVSNERRGYGQENRGFCKEFVEKTNGENHVTKNENEKKDDKKDRKKHEDENEKSKDFDEIGVSSLLSYSQIEDVRDVENFGAVVNEEIDENVERKQVDVRNEEKSVKNVFANEESELPRLRASMFACLFALFLLSLVTYHSFGH